MTKQEKFFNELSIIVIDVSKKYNNAILNSVILSQAALESGYNTNARTLFGIKCKNGIVLDTFEDDGKGNLHKEQASFYENKGLRDSVEYYYEFILTNKRYKNIVNNKNYIEVCKNLQKDGYATDINYSNKLISIIEKNNLTKYDTMQYNKVNTSNLDIIKEIISGKYGNGTERKKRIEEKGLEYDIIQKQVNNYINCANDIKKGVHGNGHDKRRVAVEKLGLNYELVRWIVNNY